MWIDGGYAVAKWSAVALLLATVWVIIRLVRKVGWPPRWHTEATSPDRNGA